MKTNQRTKKAVTRLAKSSVKCSRTRNLFIIITIALAASLITGMALSALAADKKKQRIVEHMQHVIFHDVNEEQIEKLATDDRISEIRLVKSGTLMEVDDYEVQMSYRDTASKQIDLIGVKEGNVPEKLHEAAVKKQFLKEIGKEEKLGTTFSLTFLDGTTEEFTVSGFLDDDTETRSYDILCSKEYADKGAQLKDIPYTVLARVENAEKMYQIQFIELLKEIGKDCGIDARYINENGNFVDSLKGGEASGGEKRVVLVAGAGILFVSILVIYSVFYLSVVGRIRQFGQLRTIGMNKKQIRKMLQKEGLMLGIRGIPIGFVIGTVVSYLLMPDGFSWGNTLLVGVCTAILCMAAVLISIQKPAKIAAAVSPIEALKYVGEESKSKKNETKHLKRNMSSFGLAKIAADNNRKKTILTMVTLGIGGVLIMAAGTFIMSTNEEEMARRPFFREGEFRVELSSNAIETNAHGVAGVQAENELSEQLVREIEKIDGVKKVSIEKGAQSIWEVNGESSDQELGILNEKNAKSAERYVIEGNGDLDTLLKQNQVLAMAGATEFFGEEFKVGDSVNMTFFNGETEVTKAYEIGGIISNEYNRETTLEGWFLMPEKMIQEAVGDLNLARAVVVSTEKEKRAEVEKALWALLEEKESLTLETLSEAVAASHAQNKVMMQTIIGLSVFIIAFSLINLINTIITNITSRRQEFFVLQSIGMSKKQVFRMLYCESMMLVTGNLVFTLILGSAAGYGLIALMHSMNADYMHYTFPIWFFLAYVVIVLTVPAAVTKIVLAQFEKEPLVQRMRNVD